MLEAGGRLELAVFPPLTGRGDPLLKTIFLAGDSSPASGGLKMTIRSTSSRSISRISKNVLISEIHDKLIDSRSQL